ncbi:ABC transporter permease [Roseomonas elaeocarpi]|uniref:ABC transporter permease n=1 Tax=Roseomonas elaeocarpi TaxID=907779 RepID=A0ABV6JVL0_9PROT
MRRAVPLLLLAALLGGWELACRLVPLSELVLPRPAHVALVLFEEAASGRLLHHLLVTAGEMWLGLALGTGFALPVGAALAESTALRRLAQPYLIAMQVVPKLALAPLFLLWFGFGMRSIVVITALVCFFPILENTVTGLARVDPARLELFRMLRATRWQTLLRLRLPAGLPVILAGFRVAVVLALVGAVVGEFIMGRDGLGAAVMAAQGMMDTALMFALLLAIVALGSAAYGATLLAERLILSERFLP